VQYEINEVIIIGELTSLHHSLFEGTAWDGSSTGYKKNSRSSSSSSASSSSRSAMSSPEDRIKANKFFLLSALLLGLMCVLFVHSEQNGGFNFDFDFGFGQSKKSRIASLLSRKERDQGNGVAWGTANGPSWFSKVRSAPAAFMNSNAPKKDKTSGSGQKERGILKISTQKQAVISKNTKATKATKARNAVEVSRTRSDTKKDRPPKVFTRSADVDRLYQPPPPKTRPERALVEIAGKEEAGRAVVEVGERDYAPPPKAIVRTSSEGTNKAVAAILDRHKNDYHTKSRFSAASGGGGDKVKVKLPKRNNGQKDLEAIREDDSDV